MIKHQPRTPLLAIQCLFLLAAVGCIFLPWTFWVTRGMDENSQWVTGNSAWAMKAIGGLLIALLPATFCISILERQSRISAKVFHYVFFGISILAVNQPWTWVLNNQNGSMGWGFGGFVFFDALFYATTLTISSLVQRQQP